MCWLLLALGFILGWRVGEVTSRTEVVLMRPPPLAVGGVMASWFIFSSRYTASAVRCTAWCGCDAVDRLAVLSAPVPYKIDLLLAVLRGSTEPDAPQWFCAHSAGEACHPDCQQGSVTSALV